MEQPPNCIKKDDYKKRLHKDAFKEVSEHLLDGECPVIVIEGNSAQAMIATNRKRVFVFKKGMMAGIAFGKRLYPWEFSEISGIRLDLRIVNGYVALETFETNDQEMSYWGINGEDAWTAGNAIPISKIEQEQAREGVASLRRMLHAFHNPKASHTKPAQNSPVSAPMSQSLLPNNGATFQFCFSCGSQLQPNSKFCSSCGQRLVD